MDLNACDSFGGGLFGVHLYLLALLPSARLMAYGRREREGEGACSNAAVHFTEIYELVVDGATKLRHRALRQPVVDASVDGGQDLCDEGWARCCLALVAGKVP